MIFELRKEISWADKLVVHEVVHERKKVRIEMLIATHARPTSRA